MTAHLPSTAEQRLREIDLARRAVLFDGRDRWPSHQADGGWIERSWRRCLANGQRPDERVAFDVLPPQAARRAEEANHTLIEVARPVLKELGRALAHSRYFAVL